MVLQGASAETFRGKTSPVEISHTVWPSFKKTVCMGTFSEVVWLH